MMHHLGLTGARIHLQAIHISQPTCVYFCAQTEDVGQVQSAPTSRLQSKIFHQVIVTAGQQSELVKKVLAVAIQDQQTSLSLIYPQACTFTAQESPQSWTWNVPFLAN